MVLLVPLHAYFSFFPDFLSERANPSCPNPWHVDLYKRGVKRKKAKKRARDVSIECTNNRLMVGLHGSVEAAAMADAQVLSGG